MTEGPPTTPRLDRTIASLPRVEIEDAIRAENCTYNVTVNPQKFLDLLIAFNVPPTFAKSYSLHIQRKSPPNREKLRGFYRPLHREIHLCLDNAGLAHYQNNCLKAAAILNGKPPITPFAGLVTKELPSYLKKKKTPVERKIVFAEKLFTTSAQRQVKRTLIHEVGHAVYELNYIASIITANPGKYLEEYISRKNLLSFVEEYRNIDREESEQSAQDAVTKALEFDPRFDDIVTIIPKGSWITIFRGVLRRDEKELDRKYPPTPIPRIA